VKSLECSEVEALLGGYVLTALSDQERLAAERHLASCSQHGGAIQELARSSSQLSLAAKTREPPPELRTKILAAIRAESDATSVTLGWSGERLPVGSHVCAFHADEKRLRQTMTFLQAGFDQPADFGVLFADRRRFDSLLGWLQEGYDGSIESLIDRGKLALIDGAPRVEQLMERIGKRLDRAVRDGYGLIRFLGFIGWNQPGWPDNASLVEFENRVNQVVRAYPAVVICTYDVLRLPGSSLIDGGLRSHPITILGDRVVRQNPFYAAA
jgi:hypothetical protein